MNEVIKQTADSKSSLRFRLISDADLETLPDPEYLVQDFIEESAFTGVYGPSGGGKTFVVLDAALSVATNTRWLGKAVRQAQVVYVVGEGTFGIKKRVKAWKKHHGVPVADKAFFVLAPVQLIQNSDVDGFLTQINMRGVKPGLIVFDTLATCFVGGDENSAQDMGRVVDAVRKIQRLTKAAVILVHHSGKPKESGVILERGSSALRAAADAMVRIVAAGNNIRITNDKRKDDAPAAPLVVTLKSVVVGVGSDGRDITSCVLEKVASGEAGQTTTSTGLSDEHQEALQALKVAGGVNVRTADWQQRFALSKETLARRRGWLVDNRYVAQVKKGVYSLTALGESSVKHQSPPVIDSTVLQSMSHPVGVTVTADATDDRASETTATIPLDGDLEVAA